MNTLQLNKKQNLLQALNCNRNNTKITMSQKCETRLAQWPAVAVCLYHNECNAEHTKQR